MAPALDAEWPKGERDTGPATDRVYPHLEDLVKRATPKVDFHAPIKSLLQQADECTKRAEMYMSFDHFDRAYVEYLMASSIVVDLVPHHKDYPDVRSGRGTVCALNKALQIRINAQHEKFEQVKDIIKRDNARRGLQPESPSAIQTKRSSEPLPQTQAPYGAPNAIPVPDGAPSKPGNIPERAGEAAADQRRSYHRPRTGPSQASAPSPLKRKPVVGRKPDNLRGQLRSVNGRPGREPPSTADDPLMERFAKLRNVEEGGRTGRWSAETNGHPGHERPTSASGSFERGSSTNTSSFSQLTPSSSTASLPGALQAPAMPNTDVAARGLIGPREMPAPKTEVPPHPPKLPLDTNIYDTFPRQPSPTYSPARNLPAPVTVDPPRTTARSLIGTGGRSSSVASARTPLPVAEPCQAVLSSRTNGLQKSVPIGETAISAEALFKNLKRGSDSLTVLLIDVRAREAFDDGHIFAPSIICIEPITLRPQMSAEQVSEALVLSPDNEQRLFHHRNAFDVVVYYDQSSGAGQGPVGPSQDSTPGYLRFLVEALWVFNTERPLKCAPVLLDGGLDAWEDLVGPQALKASRTAFVHRRSRQDPSRPAAADTGPSNRTARGELKQASGASRGEGMNRPVPQRAITGGPIAATAATADAVQDGYVHYPRTYDDFLRRFPEPSEIKASMVTSPANERSIIDHPFHNFTGVGGASKQATSKSSSQVAPPPTAPPSRPPPAVPRQSYSGVSERTRPPVQSPARPPPLGSAGPTVPDTLSDRPNFQVGRTGLTNFGATCYMNSVMQCLSATSPLTRYFLNGSFKQALQRNSKFGSKGLLPEAYANLMWHLWCSGFAYISPKSFREMVARLNKDFHNPDVQHDANDFLVFLLDVLHEDLNLNCSRTRLNDLTPAEERRREGMPVQVASRVEWNRWSHQNNSWISNLFGGQHLSRLQCPVCGCTSTSYETFYTLSLEIPRKGSPHLYDCLKNYTREERLGPDEAWTCPNCKVPRQASKRITITRAPQILVVQLKRFKTVRRGFTDKSNTVIDFPLTGLDLSPFCVRPPPTASVREAEAEFGQAVLDADEKTTPPFEYDAYGVVQHFGSLHGGHYTALVRGGSVEQWFEFNDRSINSFAARHVPSQAAYLLFYVRSSVQ